MDLQTYAVQELTAVARKLSDAAKQHLEASTAQLAANFERTIERLRTDQSQLVNENERLTAENAALQWEKDQLIEQAQAARRGLIDRLTRAVERIESAKTSQEILGAAIDGLADDFTSVAASSGAEIVCAVGTPVVDLKNPSTLAFAITNRGETHATLYATGELRSPEGTRLAAILARHAALAFERLMLQLKAVGELRAYAQMLLEEVEYMFTADVDGEVSDTERRARLSDNLRCARRIYSQRVTLEGPAAASVLDEVLSQLLDAKADTPFGRELADIATAPAPAA